MVYDFGGSMSYMAPDRPSFHHLKLQPKEPIRTKDLPNQLPWRLRWVTCEQQRVCGRRDKLRNI